MRKLGRKMAAVLATLSLVLVAGCSALSGARELEPGVDQSYAAFYTQPVSWSSCGDFDCANITVPIDWSDPGGKTIEIAAIRHMATDPIGNLVVNPGGPGASGVDFVRDNLEGIGSTAMRERYNIVGFDPRGTGASSPVKCLEPKGLDEFLYGVSPYESGSAEDLAWSRASIKKFVDGCAENTGDVLGHLDTQSAAKDMDVLRSYLLDDKLDYLGYSYGTMLGATYATLFPERVGRFVLDGATNPSVSDADKSFNQLVGFERALHNYAADCVKQSDCPLDGPTDLALKQIKAWLLDVEENPVPTSSGRELNIAAAVTALILAMYSEDYWQYLTQGLNEVKDGSGDTLLRMADFYNDRNEDGTYGTNILEANIAISCLDSRQPSDMKSMKAQNARLEKVGKVFGRYWQYGALTCEKWPYPVVTPPADYAAAGAPTIVVIGTTGDPATPFEQAVSLAHDILADGFLITYEGEGHTAYGRSNSCVDDTVDNFLIDGKLPEKEPVC